MDKRSLTAYKKTSKTKSVLKSGLHVLLWKEDDWYVAKAVEVEVASQGKTKKEALANIEEAMELYFEDERVSPEALPKLELHSLSPKLHV